MLRGLASPFRRATPAGAGDEIALRLRRDEARVASLDSGAVAIVCAVGDWNTAGADRPPPDPALPGIDRPVVAPARMARLPTFLAVAVTALGIGCDASCRVVVPLHWNALLAGRARLGFTHRFARSAAAWLATALVTAVKRRNIDVVSPIDAAQGLVGETWLVDETGGCPAIGVAGIGGAVAEVGTVVSIAPAPEEDEAQASSRLHGARVYEMSADAQWAR